MVHLLRKKAKENASISEIKGIFVLKDIPFETRNASLLTVLRTEFQVSNFYSKKPTSKTPDQMRVNWTFMWIPFGYCQKNLQCKQKMENICFLKTVYRKLSG